MLTQSGSLTLSEVSETENGLLKIIIVLLLKFLALYNVSQDSNIKDVNSKINEGQL